MVFTFLFAPHKRLVASAFVDLFQLMRFILDCFLKATNMVSFWLRESRAVLQRVINSLRIGPVLRPFITGIVYDSTTPEPKAKRLLVKIQKSFVLYTRYLKKRIALDRGSVCIVHLLSERDPPVFKRSV